MCNSTSPIVPLLVTPNEAAKLLAICPKSLYSLTRRGELPAVKIGTSKRYSVDTIRDFIERKLAA